MFCVDDTLDDGMIIFFFPSRRNGASASSFLLVFYSSQLSHLRSLVLSTNPQATPVTKATVTSFAQVVSVTIAGWVRCRVGRKEKEERGDLMTMGMGQWEKSTDGKTTRQKLQYFVSHKVTVMLRNKNKTPHSRPHPP